MDLTKLSKTELLVKCEKLGITKCKSKNKNILIDIINKTNKISIDKANSKKEDTISDINVIDLFCGCGGMTQGLTDAGLNIIAGIDFWDKAIDSYKKTLII